MMASGTRRATGRT